MTTTIKRSERRRNLGLVLCQLAVPALAIPSAMGVAKFFSVADGVGRWTAQGIIAALGFELMNVGLSVLDVRRPDLHPVVQRVRFWSVTTAILLNTIAHYGQRVPGLDQIDVVGGVLALVASIPLAILYVALAGLLHMMSEGAHAEADERAGLTAEIATAREELTSRTRDLARVRAELAAAHEAHAAELARAQAQSREGAQRLAAELARVQADLASEREELSRVQQYARETETQAREREARAREELATLHETHVGELREARGVAARAERESQRLAREVEELRRELASRTSRSRDALIREAQALQAERGWGASEIGRHLGWPESTVRGWLPGSRAASAAD